MLLPSDVNGRRLGILMLGMMSWGALPLSIMLEDAGSLSASPSSAVLIAWLPRSSEIEPLSEFLREEMLLRMDVGPEAPSKIGVNGCDAVGAAAVGLSGGVGGLATVPSFSPSAASRASPNPRWCSSCFDCLSW